MKKTVIMNNAGTDGKDNAGDSARDSELKKALDEYTREAAESADRVKPRIMGRLPRRVKTARRVYVRRLFAAAISLALLAAFFAYTSAGAAFAAAVKEKVIDRLFPPM